MPSNARPPTPARPRLGRWQPSPPILLAVAALVGAVGLVAVALQAVTGEAATVEQAARLAPGAAVVAAGELPEPPTAAELAALAPPPGPPEAVPAELPRQEPPEERGPPPPAAETPPRRVVKQPPPRPNRSGGAPSAAPPPPPSSAAVHDGDFPDPSIIRVGAAWYAFATQSGLTQVQVMRSADLTTWEPLGEALPRLPSWSEFGYVWAPEVLALDAGYVLYYTTRHRETGLQCISTAVSVLPEGPYLDTSEQPFVCQFERGGSIDPSPFVDADGSRWLLWKSEGTLEGEPTRIWVRRLGDDARSFTGPAYELLATQQAWERPIIEGPTMVRSPSGYHLLYAGNRWETAAYAIGHAHCQSVIGPCTRTATEPLYTGAGTAEVGPGSPSVTVGPAGDTVLAYHAWTSPHVGYPQGTRRLHLAAIDLAGPRPAVRSPWRPGVL